MIRYTVLNTLITVMLSGSLAFSYNSASNWSGGAGNGLWHDRANWTDGIASRAQMANILDGSVVGPVIGPSANAECGSLQIGGALGGTLTVNGGTLTTYNIYYNVGSTTWLGNTAGTNGAMVINDGNSVIKLNVMKIGNLGTGTLTMNDGRLQAQQILLPGNTGTGTFNFNAGMVDVNSFVMNNLGGVGRLYLGNRAMLRISGDIRSTIEGLVYGGSISALNGATVLDIYDPVLKKTVVFSSSYVLATGPSPSDGDVLRTQVRPVLSWTPGFNATSHKVYFGTDNSNLPLVATVTSPAWTLNTDLQFDTRYYWRVDEGSVKGTVWSFSTADHILIDDFESYSSSNLPATWFDSDTSAISSIALNTAYRHGGAQSLQLNYNNIAAPNYSETIRVFAAAQNWTAAQIKSLEFWIRGSNTNASVPLYVGIEDSAGRTAVVFDANTSDITRQSYGVCRVALSNFSVVDLTNVKKIFLGAGSRSNPQSGGSGTIYIDDIALYPSHCTGTQAGDLNGDCVVDIKDYAIEMLNWHKSNFWP